VVGLKKTKKRSKKRIGGERGGGAGAEERPVEEGRKREILQNEAFGN